MFLVYFSQIFYKIGKFEYFRKKSSISYKEALQFEQKTHQNKIQLVTPSSGMKKNYLHFGKFLFCLTLRGSLAQIGLLKETQ